MMMERLVSIELLDKDLVAGIQRLITDKTYRRRAHSAG